MRRWRERGQGLVEFALILPALLLLVLSIIEGAFLFQAYLAVQHAAREAARFAVTYQPPQGYELGQDPRYEAPAYPNESLEHWNARRVQLIKERAKEQAYGLVIDVEGLTEADFLAHFNEARFFGVRVFGFPGFDEPEQVDHPGLPGLPVRVYVRYNFVPFDPIIRAIAPIVPLQGEASMINEGLQVGMGNVVPPTFAPLPTLPAPTPTNTPSGGTVEPTPTPTATPTNAPTPTPTLTPTPSPTPNMAYIAFEIEKDVYTEGEEATVILKLHDPDTDYRVFWVDRHGVESPTPLFSGRTNANGELLHALPTIPEIPDGEQGQTYTCYLRSRRLDGTLVAERAVQVYVPIILPDLRVREIILPDSCPGGEPVTVTVVLENATKSTVTETFDIDIYVDPEHEPLPGQPGLGTLESMSAAKQWYPGVGPNEIFTRTYIVAFDGGGTHTVWAQVDTSNFVQDEENEDNNIASATTTVQCGFLEEDGLLVIEAENYHESISRRGETWLRYENPAFSGGAAMYTPDNGVYCNNLGCGAELRYRVTIQNPGTYRVWVRGIAWYGNDSGSDSIHVGKDNDTSYIGAKALNYFNDDYLTWQRQCMGGSYGHGGYAYLELDAGEHIINVWVREDGFIFDKLVLTLDTSSRPFPNGNSDMGPDESGDDCPALPARPKPPGLRECGNIVSQGGFEVSADQPDVFTPNGAWTRPTANDGEGQQYAVGWSTTYANNGVHSILFRCDQHAIYGWVLNPWLYQTVRIPTWISSTQDVTVELNVGLSYLVPLPNSRAQGRQEDVLYVKLKDGATDLTPNVVITHGNALRGSFVPYQANLATYFDPVAYAGRDVTLYFSAPNDGSGDTEFYFDDVRLDVCTTVKPPPVESDKAVLGGMARVLIGGVPVEREGVNVWAYSQSGEFFTTYSIQDGSYSFYNLPPGTYTIYAEVWIGDRLYWTSDTVTVTAGDRIRNFDLLLQ